MHGRGATDPFLWDGLMGSGGKEGILTRIIQTADDSKVKSEIWAGAIVCLFVSSLSIHSCIHTCTCSFTNAYIDQSVNSFIHPQQFHLL